MDSYKYTEADELEDAILFPYEAVPGLLPNDLYHHVPSAMEMFETQPIDIRKFAGDLDTDDEVESSQSSEGTDLGEAELDDDSNWEDDSIDGSEYVMESDLRPGERPDFVKAMDVLN